MKVKANLTLPTSKELMKSVGFNEGGRIQKYIDNFVFNKSEPYLPGYHIHRESKSANHPGDGQVIWITPDSEYLYEGMLMVDPITLKGSFFSPNYGHWSRPHEQKIMDPNMRELEYHGGGLRGPKWFDRMIEDEVDSLVKGVQNIANGGK